MCDFMCKECLQICADLLTSMVCAGYARLYTVYAHAGRARLLACMHECINRFPKDGPPLFVGMCVRGLFSQGEACVYGCAWRVPYAGAARPPGGMAEVGTPRAGGPIPRIGKPPRPSPWGIPFPPKIQNWNF